ncbi:MAG: hypothetical protein NC217_03020 [Muribaculaceae bacterium]|nr:hypothetical protein [Muribaculaceae bacterium]
MKFSYHTSYMLAAGIILAAGCVSCHTAKSADPAVSLEPKQAQLPLIGSEVQAMPMAIVYQTDGDNAMDLVPITLSADGKTIVSYPAPSDLNEGQTPIDLGDGWWLDRRGIGPNTVFTTYTYEDYEAMKQAPSIKDLMNHIDRNAHITRMIELPITAAEAAADPAVVRAYTESGFTDCREIPLR